MNPHLELLLSATDTVMSGSFGLADVSAQKVHVGVDLGTAYTVLIVLGENYLPIGGSYCFAQVVRDGLVVDFDGAIQLVKKLKKEVESKLGVELIAAASGYPPGVPLAEVRATRYVLEAAGLECTGLIDEPSAANRVLQVENGAIVDVGGGTTGIAIVENGKVVYTADEPTGGTHFSLVIAGAKDIPFEQAEEIKKEPEQQRIMFPLVRPVMEKVASIVGKHIRGYHVPVIYLVGGTCAYPGMSSVVEAFTGIKTVLPCSPLFVTPLGIAMYDGLMERN